MKRLIPWIIVVAVIGLVYMLLSLRGGQMTILFIQSRIDMKIEYENLHGNIFRGFKAEQLKVRLSDQDSLWAQGFEIKYRLLPLIFRKASAIEISLVKPHLDLHVKEQLKPRAQPSLIALALNLSIKVEDGAIRYIGQDTLVMEGVSGSTGIMIQGNQLNLVLTGFRFELPQNNLQVNKLNAACRVRNNKIDCSKLILNARGLEFEGSGIYSFTDKLVSLAVKRASVNLNQFSKLVEGRAELRGNITYQGKKLWGDGEVEVFSLRPMRNSTIGIDYSYGKFRAREDTLSILIEKGRVGSGKFDGEIKIERLREYSLHIFIDSLNLQEIDGSLPLFVTKGELAYHSGKLRAKIIPYNPGLDSARFIVSIAKGRVAMDSLFGYCEAGKILVRGDILPKPNLFMHARRFPIGFLRNFYPVEMSGLLSGSFSIAGSYPAPNMTGRFKLLDLNIGKVCQATVVEAEVSLGRMLQKISSLSLQAVGMKIGPQRIDSLKLRLNNEGFLVDIRSAEAMFLNVHGTIKEKMVGKIDSLAGSLNGVAIRSRRPIAFDLNRRQVGEIELDLGKGRVSAHFDSLRHHLRLEEIRLEEVSKIINKPLYNMAGILNLQLDNELLKIEVDSLQMIDLIKDGQMVTNGKFMPGKILIDTCSITGRDKLRFNLHGTLSPELLDLQSDFTNFDLRIFAILDKIFELGRGQVAGRISIGGSLTDPYFTGKVEFRNADFKLRLTESTLNKAAGRITLDGKKIIIENVEGSCGDGWARGQGYVQLGPRFRMTDLELRVVMENCLGSFRPIVYGIGSGKIKIFYHKGMADYQGDVNVKEAVLPIGFGTVIAQTNQKTPENWRMNIKFTADRNVWLKSNIADVELEGEVFLMKGEADVYLSGETKSRRGNVYYLDHALRVTEGKVTFTSAPEFNPIVDIRSEMMARETLRSSYASRARSVTRFLSFSLTTQNGANRI